jgi:adenosylcobyric acid synthase
LIHVPVLGVLPYLRVDIDEEDSLAERLRDNDVRQPVDIAVIRLPRISNFTDFSALARINNVGVRYVNDPARLGEPDLIIVPGTKSTMADLRRLRQNGMEAAIKKHAAAGTLIFGVCGGYQMLGETLSDPDTVEDGGVMRGMELLPVTTVFEPEKVRTRVGGAVTASSGAFARLRGAGLTGYEIHMGKTTLNAGAEPLCRLDNGEVDGAVCGNVAGSYVHGLFDGALGMELAHMLLREKGIDGEPEVAPDINEYKNQQYDLLAAGLREHLDIARIYEILNAGGNA